MPPKRRPYVPKTKGCHECSQRRIHCDRTEPHCKKCFLKGLKCSGLGIRHRFNDGVAARGKWVGKTMELVYKEKEEKLNGRVTKPPEITDRATGTLVTESSKSPSESQTDIARPRDELESNASQFLAVAFHSRASSFKNNEELLSFTNAILFQPVPDSISRGDRNLLLHFSEHIANEMIAFDGFHNGWRHLVLPLAQTDDLVVNAVLATAAAHQRLNQLSNNKLQTNMYTLWHPKSSQLYARAIRGLQQRQELVHGDQSSKYSILVTILVLLTAVMVTGCSDFPVLFRMLESAVTAMGGIDGLGDGELTDFIMRQVHKMRVYAAPLLCEQTGVEIISSQKQTAQLFDCLNYSTRQYPDQAWVLSNVSEVVDQARDIYLHQVFLDPQSSSSLDTAAGINSISRVQRFKESLEAFPLDSPGQKVLVWATFVAASDCKLEEHKVFFEGVLMRHFARSGFGNVLKGVESLRQIWKRRPGERWTSLLPEAKVLVM